MSGPFAIITGASSGIGLELARLAAGERYDLLLASDTAMPAGVEEELRGHGVTVEVLEVDLSTVDGVDRLLEAAGDRTVNVLCANAGHGLGGPFLGQEAEAWQHVVATNITGTVHLLQRILKPMAERGAGKVLVTGSIAGYMPGSFQAVYNASKAFIDSFTAALRNELRDRSGITITTLLPGPVDTDFFERAKLMDTSVGVSEDKSAPAHVARDGWLAMKDGRATIVSGWANKLQVLASRVLPEAMVAERHRQMAEPGSAGR